VTHKSGFIYKNFFFTVELEQGRGGGGKRTKLFWVTYQASGDKVCISLPTGEGMKIFM